jgi:hypothetical protein
MAPSRAPTEAANRQSEGVDMKNVSMQVEGNKLIITVDLAQDFGPSASGKNIIIATTEGNQSVPGAEDKGIKIGLNIYRKK